MGKIVGRWWNNPCLDIVEIESRFFVLNDWNGENWGDCFEVAKDLCEIIDKSVKHCIAPIYIEHYDDDFEIVGYKKLLP